MKNITIKEMVELNTDAGQHYFEEDTMRFFNSIVETAPDEEGMFITSEKDHEQLRKYSIRKFDLETYEVSTVGKFQEYDSLKQAIRFMNYKDNDEIISLLKEHRCEFGVTLVNYIIDYYANKMDEYDNIKLYMWDVVQKGCESGIISEFIYTQDNCKFFDKFAKDIFEFLSDRSDISEEDTLIKYIATFKYSDYICDLSSFKEKMVWIAFEQITQHLLDIIEDYR